MTRGDCPALFGSVSHLANPGTTPPVLVKPRPGGPECAVRKFLQRPKAFGNSAVRASLSTSVHQRELCHVLGTRPEHLRARTHELHRRAESLVDLSSLDTLARYRALLSLLLGFHRPLERRLARVDLGAVGLDLRARLKAPPSKRIFAISASIPGRSRPAAICRRCPRSRRRSAASTSSKARRSEGRC